MASHIGRRKFLAKLGGAAAPWPLAARTRQAGKRIKGEHPAQIRFTEDQDVIQAISRRGRSGKRRGFNFREGQAVSKPN
jgi:hypothetical protein